MEFNHLKQKALLEQAIKMHKDPKNTSLIERYHQILQAKTLNDLNPNPNLDFNEYSKLIDIAYSAVSLNAHMRITINNGHIATAEIAPPGTRGFSSPKSFLI